MTNGAETRIRRSRDRIFTAAEDVFLRNGFPGTNMDAVAEAAGVSKQTVYAHFISKEALFLQVVERITGGAAQQIGEDVPDDFSGVSAQSSFLDVAQDQLRVVMTPRLMRLRRMVIAEVDRFPMLGQALWDNGPQRSITRITAAIRHYVASGDLQVDDPPVAAAHFNWLVMGGPTSVAMFLGDRGIPSQAALAAHARDSVRLFLAAYGKGAD